MRAALWRRGGTNVGGSYRQSRPGRSLTVAAGWVAVLVVVFSLAPMPVAHVAAQNPQDYVLTPGDSVDVSVFGEPSVSRTVTIRPDGKIRFKGKVFNSPSLAASAVTKRAMNGWWCWRYEAAPGQWERLDRLRRG